MTVRLVFFFKSYICETNPVAHGGSGKALVVDKLTSKLASLKNFAFEKEQMLHKYGETFDDTSTF